MRVAEIIGAVLDDITLLEDQRGELAALQPWFATEQFDRRALNRVLAELSCAAGPGGACGMRITVQVTLEGKDETTILVEDVFTLRRRSLAPDTLGMHLDEAKNLLCAVQGAVVGEQVRAALAAAPACPDCGTPRRHKDAREIVVRSLFGTLRLPSPRWINCRCQSHETRTLSPLAALIAERTTPELRYRAGEAISSARRIDDQPGRQQADGQEAADALEPPRSAPPAPDPNQGPQRRPRHRLPPLVPELQPHPDHDTIAA
jgi:hypothetical protein